MGPYRARICVEGAISHNDLENLTGQLSYAQTSVFGRFGRTLLRPFRDKLKRRHYAAKLSADEIDILKWWVYLLRDGVARICFLKSPLREVIIYTDAATSTRTVATLVTDFGDFGSRGISKP